jgi:hypothetical protein
MMRYSGDKAFPLKGICEEVCQIGIVVDTQDLT